MQTDTALVRAADVAVLDMLLPAGGLASPLRFNTSWTTWGPAPKNHIRVGAEEEGELEEDNSRNHTTH